jgi:hypothetical protein
LLNRYLTLANGDDLSSEVSQATAREILSYLLRNPDAKDTVNGIIKWWLPESERASGVEKVLKALEFLVVTKGWLTVRDMRSAGTIYGLNKARLKEISNFLSESQN